MDPNASDYRVQSLHNDRKNKRCARGPPQGDNWNRGNRTNTIRHFNKNETKCPFRLPIWCDDQGYFTKAGSGCGFHEHHKKLDSKTETRPSTKNVSEVDAQLIRHCTQAYTSNSVARNLYLLRNDSHLLSLQQIKSIFKKGDIISDDDGGTVDILQQYFHKTNASCCFLYQSKIHHAAVMTSPPPGVNATTSAGEVLVPSCSVLI